MLSHDYHMIVTHHHELLLCALIVFPADHALIGSTRCVGRGGHVALQVSTPHIHTSTQAHLHHPHTTHSSQILSSEESSIWFQCYPDSRESPDPPSPPPGSVRSPHSGGGSRDEGSHSEGETLANCDLIELGGQAYVASCNTQLSLCSCPQSVSVT